MKKIIFVVCLICVSTFSFAAGTVTVAEYRGVVDMVKFTWTSNSTGNATGSSTYGYSGEILKVMFDPDDTAVPSANYDMTITDGTGLDVLNSQGVNLSNSTVVYADVNATFPVSVGNLNLAVSNAGNATQGAVYIWIK